MYYAASTSTDDAHGGCTAFCIGVAPSAAAAGPFVDAAPPLVCDAAYAAIDPKSFDDGSGGIFLIYGSGGAPLMVRALDASRTAWAAGSAAIALLQPDEGRPYESLVEGAWLHAHAGALYLFYSGDACCGAGANYAVSVARAASPLGPFTRRGDADGTRRDWTAVTALFPPLPAGALASGLIAVRLRVAASGVNYILRSLDITCR
jgi:arabinan endo-1,5-alpha-L-arabinosidase